MLTHIRMLAMVLLMPWLMLLLALYATIGGAFSRRARRSVKRYLVDTGMLLSACLLSIPLAPFSLALVMLSPRGSRAYAFGTSIAKRMAQWCARNRERASYEFRVHGGAA